MKSFWKTFLTSNETKYRLARTILQGVIAVLIANMDTIVSQFHLSADMRALIVALIMAILSPIMSELGAAIKETDDDEDDDEYEDCEGIPERMDEDDDYRSEA